MLAQSEPPLHVPARISLKSARAFADALSGRWTALCDTYAPHRDPDDFWRFPKLERLVQQQGWKIHLSATLLSAVDLFESCAETLVRSECQFKVAASMGVILRLNYGMAGKSQTGKIITVYCPDPDRARALAEELHLLTRGLPGPLVPSDRRFRPGSNVYYRYGAYDNFEIEIDGRKVRAYRDPSGTPVPDKRTRATAVPSWADDPFSDVSAAEDVPQRRNTNERYVAFKSLGWRGRGGVYLVRRTGEKTPRQYVMKEGLLHGDVGIDGRDGVHRVRNEFRALKSLTSIVPAPAPVDFFYQDGNAYLVIEFVDGKNVNEVLQNGELPLEKSILMAWQMVDIVASLHAAGWCWRDCKTRNFLYSDEKVCAIDFESAGRIRGRSSTFGGTKGYFLEHEEVVSGRAGELQDLYALGTTLHRVFAGFSDEKAIVSKTLPPLPADVPPSIRDLIASLRHEVPRQRPSAASAKCVFRSFVAGYHAGARAVA
jgi:Protein kinase domain